MEDPLRHGADLQAIRPHNWVTRVVEAESREVRPPDRRRILPWKITVRSGAQRHPKDASVASALDGDLCAATECPARGGRPGQLRGAAVTGGALERVPAACGCGGCRPEAAPRPVGFRP